MTQKKEKALATTNWGKCLQELAAHIEGSRLAWSARSLSGAGIGVLRPLQSFVDMDRKGFAETKPQVAPCDKALLQSSVLLLVIQQRRCRLKETK